MGYTENRKEKKKKLIYLWPYSF